LKPGIGLAHGWGNEIDKKSGDGKCNLEPLTHFSPLSFIITLAHPRNYFKTLLPVPIQPAPPSLINNKRFSKLTNLCEYVMIIQTLYFRTYFTVFWEFNPETNKYCVFGIFKIIDYIDQEI
jgi:hypothetical protein